MINESLPPRLFNDCELNVGAVRGCVEHVYVVQARDPSAHGYGAGLGAEYMSEK
jgi:hypothetical protein